MQMTFRNEQDGVESRIQQISNGKYAVTFWDLDSGKCIPVARHYVDLDRAIDCARQWANLGPSPKTIAAPDTSPLRGSLPTVEVLKRLASYMQQMEGLPLDCCLRMALEVLDVQHREDADMYVRAAKAQMGGEA